MCINIKPDEIEIRWADDVAPLTIKTTTVGWWDENDCDRENPALRFAFGDYGGAAFLEKGEDSRTGEQIDEIAVFIYALTRWQKTGRFA